VEHRTSRKVFAASEIRGFPEWILFARKMNKKSEGGCNASYENAKLSEKEEHTFQDWHRRGWSRRHTDELMSAVLVYRRLSSRKVPASFSPPRLFDKL